MPKPPPRPSRDEVLRWARENPGKNATEVAAHFPGLSPNTVRSWLKRDRDSGRATPTLPPNLVSLPAPEKPDARPREAGPADQLAALLAPLLKLPIRELARLAVAIRIARLALGIDPHAESVADSAKIAASLLDRFNALEGLEPVEELDPTSEAGIAALQLAMKSFPPETVAKMLEARAS